MNQSLIYPLYQLGFSQQRDDIPRWDLEFNEYSIYRDVNGVKGNYKELRHPGTSKNWKLIPHLL